MVVVLVVLVWLVVFIWFGVFFCLVALALFGCGRHVCLVVLCLNGAVGFVWFGCVVGLAWA